MIIFRFYNIEQFTLSLSNHLIRIICMLKNKIFLLFISALTLSGCTQTIDGDDHSSSQSSSGSDTSIDDNCPIDKIALTQSSYYFVFGSAGGKIYDLSQGLHIKMKDGYKWEDVEDYTMTWESSNESAMTVSQYGVITKVAKGVSTIKAKIVTSDGGIRSTSATVELVDSLVDKFVRVDDVLSLSNNDQIVIACPEKGVAMSKTRVSGYLVPATLTFNSNKSEIASLSDDVAIYMLGAHSDYSNVFELYEADLDLKLAAKNTKNVEYINNTGNTYWAFESEDDGVYISSISSVLGQLMYNANNGGSGNKFTIYDSEPQFDMLLPTVYKSIKVKA